LEQGRISLQTPYKIIRELEIYKLFLKGSIKQHFEAFNSSDQLGVWAYFANENLQISPCPILFIRLPERRQKLKPKTSP